MHATARTSQTASPPSSLSPAPRGRIAAASAEVRPAQPDVPTRGFDFAKIPIQRKPAISSPGDAFEREADAVADKVMRMADTAAIGRSPLSIQRACAACEDDDKKIRTKRASATSAAANLDTGAAARAASHGGAPLSNDVRAHFEPLFGHDFSHVRVHTGGEAASAARSVQARAYTYGRDIVFGAGQFSPSTPSGGRLLAHELTHVVQQSGTKGACRSSPVTRPGEARPTIAREPAPANRQLGAGPQLPADAQMVDLAKIEYTQADISFKTGGGVSLGRMAARMRQTGWDISQPADVVKMNDGRLVSLDHRRLWAADRAGISQVSVRIHLEADVLAADTAARFEIDKGRVPQGTNPRTGAKWKAGDAPRTWGEAVSFRSAGQGFSKVGRGSNSGFDPKALPGGGVRDPSFPATGSKDMPMRVQPGPLEQRIDPTAGGSVNKSGGVRKNVPTGKLVTGVIEGTTTGTGPSGGGPGSTGPGGAKAVAETKPTVIEGRGPPVSEIVASPHAQSINATRGAMEGAWSIILAGQLSYVRGAELKKAIDALAALEPTIEKLRQKGIDVTVSVIAEIPDRPDVAALATGTGDPSQIVRFRDMFISHLSLPASAATSTVSTMYDAGGHSRDFVGRGDMTLDQQIRSQLGDKYPVPGTGPHTGFHFAEGKQVFPGFAQPKAEEPAAPMATRTKGLTGTWTPEFRQIFAGDINQVIPLATRVLKVDVDASGAATPRMALGSRAYAFENGGPSAKMVMTGRFKMGEGYPPQAQWYWSSFEYYPEKGLILEWAHGQDLTHDYLWDALFLWRRL